MRVAYISAGAGGMLCGSCMHDNTLAAALTRLGHDVALVPTYTPMRTDEHDVSLPQVFYGAVNLYLQQRSALFRHTPRAIDRLLDMRAVLGWAARAGSSTSAADLGDLTLSVLQGEEGRQAKELERLSSWLRDSFRPQIVHLSNSMFLGMARRLRQELGVPIVCSVQGEDLFIEGLPDTHRERVTRQLRERARDADVFVATSRYYADYMAGLLGVPGEKMRIVSLGLNLEGHGATAPGAARSRFRIGYMARISPEKGLHLLAEAFGLLAREPGAPPIELAVAGWLGPRDRSYLQQVQERIRSLGLEGSFQYQGEIDRAEKIRFLGSLDVLCVPATFREPKGLYVLEALANGVPVVEPRHGALPELIESTGGGLLFEPGSARDLAAALARLRDDPAGRAEMGRRGRQAVLDRFSDRVMAEETLKVYLACLPPTGGS